MTQFRHARCTSGCTVHEISTGNKFRQKLINTFRFEHCRTIPGFIINLLRELSFHYSEPIPAKLEAVFTYTQNVVTLNVDTVSVTISAQVVLLATIITTRCERFRRSHEVRTVVRNTAYFPTVSISRRSALPFVIAIAILTRYKLQDAPSMKLQRRSI